MREALLCSSCSNAADVARLFDAECNLKRLERTSQGCDLCHLLFAALCRAGKGSFKEVILRQDGAVVGIEGGVDLLSIYAKPGT